MNKGMLSLKLQFPWAKAELSLLMPSTLSKEDFVHVFSALAESQREMASVELAALPGEGIH